MPAKTVVQPVPKVATSVFIEMIIDAGDERRHGADREIDAAGDDDERRADGDDADKRRPREDVGEVRDREKGGVDRRSDDHEQDQGEERSDRLRSCRRATMSRGDFPVVFQVLPLGYSSAFRTPSRNA